MKMYSRVFLAAGLSVAFLTGSFASGEGNLTPRKPKANSQAVVEAVIETEPLAESGLTPHRKVKTNEVVLAQQPSPTWPLPPAPPSPRPETTTMPLLAAAPAPPATPPIVHDHPDAYVSSELGRLSAEIEKLKKGTKKPDTKKEWGTPKVAGRLYIDSFSTSQNEGADATYAGDPFRNKTGISEMMMTVTGEGFDAFDYKTEISLAPTDGKVNFVDNWIGAKNLPLFGYARAGHYKPETGLNFPGSTNHTTLTEFSGPAATFGFGRRLGVSSETLYANDKVRLFYGVFQDGLINTNRYIHDDNQGEVFNMRLSTTPYYACEGKYVLHVGGNWSYVASRKNTTSLNIKPGSIAWYDPSMKTGDFANNSHHRAGLELAYQAGAFTVQSEAYIAKYGDYATPTLGYSPDRTATGAYLELKYFLTGDYRTYLPKKGVFGPVKVERNFHPFASGNFNLIDGLGAWQAVLQYSYMDMGDWRGAPGSIAGRQHDITVGMNWFWTPNIRWIFEYVHSQQNVGAAYTHCTEDIFGTSIRVFF